MRRFSTGRDSIDEVLRLGGFWGGMWVTGTGISRCESGYLNFLDRAGGWRTEERRMADGRGGGEGGGGGGG
jgi:hypothetical protein